MILPQIRSWWLLWLATIITIAIVAASQLFTEKISTLLDRQASELLAADLLISSNHPLPDRYLQLAREYGLETAITVSLRSVIFIDDEPQLVELKATSANYPLRGSLETKLKLFAVAQKQNHGPNKNEIWVDTKIESQLGTDIEIGAIKLKASQILSYEPDRGGSLFNLAPRVMMSLENLEDTALIVPGSRAKYRLLVAGSSQSIENYEFAINDLLSEDERIQSLQNARPEMRNALDRTRKFFALAIVLTLVIAMIAIAITARYSASKESTKVAVLRTFGISTSNLLIYYFQQIIKVWLWALPFGLLLGFLAQFPLQWILGFWFGTRLPETGFLAYFLASIVGLVSLTGFSLPSILTVLDTPPMQVFRRSLIQVTRTKSLLLLLISLFTLGAVLMLIVQHIELATILFMMILVVAFIIPVLLKGIIIFLERWKNKRFWIKGYLFTRLLNPQRNALFIMSGFSLTLLSVLLISSVKDQLLNDWEAQLPEDKPNYFLVNIPSHQAHDLSQFLVDNKIPSSNPYALINARLTSINKQPIETIDFKNPQAQNLLNHTFKLSYSEKLPPDNIIVKGKWFQQMQIPDGFSVEEGMANKLNLKLGDILQFTVAGEDFAAAVTSFRKVNWENFQPNFYVLGLDKMLQDKPQTWLMSSYFTDQNKPLLKPLITQFPSVTLLDISELMKRIKGIIQRASLALEFFFIFATISAIIVLFSALNTSRHDRESEIALLQTLGADKTQTLSSQVAEFLIMGFIVGIFAAVSATLIGWVVGTFFFQLPFQFSISLWVQSIFVSVVIITVSGTLFIYKSLAINPMKLLRS